MAQKASTKAAPSEVQNDPKFDIRIKVLDRDDNLLAYASANIHGDFSVRGIKVLNGSHGMFISMPQYRTADGDYKDICFFNTKASSTEFSEAVISAYLHEFTMSQRAANGQKQAMAGMAGM